ncbi:SlyX family protein [Desulfopila sp. IMCC35008]|uniref:SlyX family protein n=1 Tax=Desulfopila sp. IMCC35008 TaxID=2653858 RepID=UPI0013D89C9A|nr:SlyX family protein [Desulfopila sp. IMCC35008]
MSQELENRIQLLEEKFEYQDMTIETLNEVIIRQQRSIDKLQTDLQLLKEQLLASSHNLEDVNEPPPHY